MPLILRRVVVGFALSRARASTRPVRLPVASIPSAALRLIGATRDHLSWPSALPLFPATIAFPLLPCPTGVLMSPSRCPFDVGRESQLPMIRSVCVRLQACLLQLYLLRPAPVPSRGGYSHLRGMARCEGRRRRELPCGAPLGVGPHPMLLLPRWFSRTYFG
jgi:hypothetical protein